jgi:hypothetical protein
MSHGTSHHFTPSLHSTVRRPAAPPPIRLQVALTLGDILVIVLRHLVAAPRDLQATVQRRMLGTTDHVLWTRIELHLGP